MSHCEVRLNPPDYAYHRPRMQLVRRRCNNLADFKVREHYVCGSCYSREWRTLHGASEEVLRSMITFGSLWKDMELPELVPGKPHYVMDLHA